MSFTGRLIHTVAIERPQQTVVGLVPQYDDYNQPVTEYVSITEESAAFIWPLRSNEIRLTSDAGAGLTDHGILLPIDADLTGADRLHNVDTGEVHEVRGIRPHRYGGSPHIRVDTHLVTSIELPVEA